MRYLSLLAVLGALAFAAPASAVPYTGHGRPAGASRAQDLAHLQAGGLTGRTSKDDTLAQRRPAGDRTPWDAMAAGIALIAIGSAGIGIVRTRRRVSIAA
jgi:hypothetical protein